jgi:hypothetical protein
LHILAEDARLPEKMVYISQVNLIKSNVIKPASPAADNEGSEQPEARGPEHYNGFRRKCRWERKQR